VIRVPLLSRKNAADCIELSLAAIRLIPVYAVHLCECRLSFCDHGGLLNIFCVEASCSIISTVCVTVPLFAVDGYHLIPVYAEPISAIGFLC
jgi:hypothetical protein